MGNDTTANIILRLKDEFSKELKQAGSTMEDFGKQVDRAGTFITRSGMKMVAIGTEMSAPFYAATMAMTKYSNDAKNEMDRLGNIMLSLSQVMTTAALPTIKTLNDQLSKLVNALRSVDPDMLQNIAHWILLAGKIFLTVGVIEIFIGKVISLTGKLMEVAGGIVSLAAEFPELTIAILTVAAGMYIFQTTWQKVTFECQKVWLEFVIFVEEKWKGLLQIIAQVPGANSFASTVDAMTISIQAMKLKLAGLNAGGKSDLQAFVDDAMAKLKALKKTFDDASPDLKTVMKDWQTSFKETAQSFSDGFATSFSDVLFQGKTFADSMKDLFKKMGQDIVNEFIKTVGSNLIAKIFGGQQTSGSGLGGLAAVGIGSIFGPVGAAIGGGLSSLLHFHNGGPIYAHNGLAPDEVPIIAQTGEGVLSRKGMAAVGGSNNLRKLNAGGSTGGQTIVINQVIQAWDASDVYRNRKALSQAIADEIKNNGNMRSTINNYR